MVIFSLWGRFYFYSFQRFIRASFKLRIQCPCNIHSAQLLYNSHSYLAFERENNLLSYALVIIDCYYQRDCHKFWCMLVML